jgi:hypothetical protein
VLDRVALDAVPGKARAYEADLCVAQLTHTRPGGLLLLDRNCPAHRMLAELARRRRGFAAHCPAASFAQARRMLEGGGPDSLIATLTPCAGQSPAVKAPGLPASVRVRFVRILPGTGEFAVLATSLLDEAKYPAGGFLELHGLRWGGESFYGLLKTRLELGNFTGTGAEAVRQDLHAAVYLSGLESILTAPAQAKPDAKKARHP